MNALLSGFIKAWDKARKAKNYHREVWVAAQAELQTAMGQESAPLTHCSTCGRETISQPCPVCYEVELRLDEYLKSSKGLEFVTQAINRAMQERVATLKKTPAKKE